MGKFRKKLEVLLPSRSRSRSGTTSDGPTPPSTTRKLDGSRPPGRASLGPQCASQAQSQTEQLEGAGTVDANSLQDPNKRPRNVPAGNLLAGNSFSLVEGAKPNPSPSTVTSAVSENTAPTTTANDPTPLNSSALWERALENVKVDPDWEKYSQIINGDANLAGSDFSCEAIIAIAQSVSDQIESSKLSLRLAGRTVVIRDILDNAVCFLTVIKDAGAVATAPNPIAAAAWSGIQIFVQAAVTYKGVRDLCWAELPRMVRLVSEYLTFELLYDTSQLHHTRLPLENALVKLFTAILKYQIVIVKYARSWSDKVITATQGIAASAPQQAVEDVKICEEQVAKLQTFADREINDFRFQTVYERVVVNSQELRDISSRFIGSLSRVVAMQNRTNKHMESVSDYVEDMQKKDILDWISTIQYQDIHNSRSRKAMTGTCLWLLRHPDYKNWRMEDQGSVMWLHGSMGSGKSCLTHAVIEDIQSVSPSADNRRKTAYFYCDGSSNEGRDNVAAVENILRCLVKQLCHGGDGKLMRSVVNIYKETRHGGHLVYGQCVDLLVNLIDEAETTDLIIDGLDECSHEVQIDLVASFTTLFNRCISTLHLFLSSRHTEFIVDLLEQLPRTQIDTAHNNKEDIVKVVAQTAHEAALHRSYQRLYLSNGTSQEADVVQQLVEMADSMFRWVQVAFDYLHKSPTYYEMSWRLEQLSHLGDVFDLYDEVYHEMTKDVGPASLLAIRILLVFMLHGEKSLPQLHAEDGLTRDALVRHIVEACNFRASLIGPTTSLTSRDLHALCPNLVDLTTTSVLYEESEESESDESQSDDSERDESECDYQVFKFAHVSVREWLLEKHSNHFSVTKGHSYLAQLCMDVLMATAQNEIIRNIDSPRNSPSEGMSALKKYSFFNWLQHAHSAAITLVCEASWAEEAELREALEVFLFKDNSMNPNPGLSSLRTGFCRWHQLGQAQYFDSPRTLLTTGKRTVFVDPQRISRSSSLSYISFDRNRDKTSEHDRSEQSYISMWRLLGEEAGPAAWRGQPPNRIILPAFICAILGNSCDFSKIEPAALDVDIYKRSKYDWQTRSIAAVIKTGDFRPLHGLIQKLQPSSQMLADALVLMYMFGPWEDEWLFLPDQKRIQSRTSELLDLLMGYGMQLEHPNGQPKCSLIVNLIRVRYVHPIEGYSGSTWAIALMIAAIVDRGADPYRLIHPDELCMDRTEDDILDNGLLSADTDRDFMARDPDAEPLTLFDHVLNMFCPPATDALAPTFFSKDWDESIWSRWLNLATNAMLDTRYACSSNIVKELCGRADPLRTDSSSKFWRRYPQELRALERSSPYKSSKYLGGKHWLYWNEDDDGVHWDPDEDIAFHMALKNFDMDGSILDMLSSRTLAVHGEIPLDVVDPQGRFFLSAIVPKCTKSTIKLWLKYGADPHLVHNQSTALSKARIARRPDIEELFKSLGVRELSPTPRFSRISDQNDPDTGGETYNSRLARRAARAEARLLRTSGGEAVSRQSGDTVPPKVAGYVLEPRVAGQV